MKLPLTTVSSLPKIVMPWKSLPDMTLSLTVVLSPRSMTTPLLLGEAAVPDVVPIRLPVTTLPSAPTPLIRTPETL
jgi:hypothetical protein